MTTFSRVAAAASATCLHSSVLALNIPGYTSFVAALGQVERTQRGRLRQVLSLAEGSVYGKRVGLSARDSYEEFAARVPVVQYSDLEADLISQRELGAQGTFSRSPCVRYQPTSGSTSRRKWIPYTKALLSEFDAALAPWIVDLLQRMPQVLTGRHYWSVSWLPDELRGKSTTDDTQLLPAWKRSLVLQAMAVPTEVQHARSSEAALFATGAWLAACHSELVLSSVWSPTFFLQLLQLMAENRFALADCLEQGRWVGLWKESLLRVPAPRSKHAAGLLRGWNGSLDSEFLQTLWPRLSLLSAWDSASSAPYAAELQALFPQCAFQGKGLWATEAVITIPFQSTYPLALTSHFLEFRNLSTGKIHPAWDLRMGHRYSPIVTTGSGLLRYAFSDEVEVSGFLEECPCLVFKGRLSGVDLVGEKTHTATAAGTLQNLADLPGVRRCVTLFAVQASPRPYYALLAEGDWGGLDKCAAVGLEAKLARLLEEQLAEHHHYRLARELGQLGPARTLVRENALDAYFLYGKRAGLVTGEQKIEPLVLCREEAHLP